MENDGDELNAHPSGWDKRFSGFEGKLAEHDRRFDIVDGKLAEHDRRFDIVEEKLAEHDRRFDIVEGKLAEHDRRFDAIEGHFPDLHAYIAFSIGEFSRQTNDLRRELKEGFSESRAAVQRLERKLDQLIEASLRG